eukprot:s3175_g1.t1
MAAYCVSSEFRHDLKPTLSFGSCGNFRRLYANTDISSNPRLNDGIIIYLFFLAFFLISYVEELRLKNGMVNTGEAFACDDDVVNLPHA